jgi:hypothetical protein
LLTKRSIFQMNSGRSCSRFPTVYAVKRRFVETKIWPSSRGAYVPEMEPYHLVMLLLALGADVPAKDASATARAYFELPDRDGNKVGHVLTRMIQSLKIAKGAFVDKDDSKLADVSVAALACRSRIEVDCGTPRVCIVSETTATRKHSFGSRLCVVPKPSQNANYTLQKTYGAPLHEGQRLIQVFSGVARSRW